MSKKTEFDKLQKEWYAKLKESGFKDIEKDENTLIKPVNRVFSTYEKFHKTVKWQAKQEYYTMAEHFLNSYQFETPLDEAIWAYHTEGMGVREIASTLIKVGSWKTNRTSVWQSVKKNQVIMRKLMWAEFTDTSDATEQ